MFLPELPVAAEPVAVAGLPISADEPLTRFVFEQDHLNLKGDQLHWRAFRPKPTENELSIGRIHDLDAAGIWTLGREMAGGPHRQLRGRGDFTESAVVAGRNAVPALSVTPDEPPPRHALIVGWPVDNVEARKAACMVLAAESTRHLLNQAAAL